MTWIVLGTSPRAADDLRRATSWYPNAKIVTCNRGFRLVKSPDAYVLMDRKAVAWWIGEAREMRNRYGTILVTQAFHLNQLRDWGLTYFDVLYDRKVHGGWGTSGVWSAYHALRTAHAERVVVAGCSGYPSNESESAYFGEYTPIRDGERRNQAMAERWATLIDEFHDRRFEFLGPLAYDLPERENVKVFHASDRSD